MDEWINTYKGNTGINRKVGIQKTMDESDNISGRWI